MNRRSRPPESLHVDVTRVSGVAVTMSRGNAREDEGDVARLEVRGSNPSRTITIDPTIESIYYSMLGIYKLEGRARRIESENDKKSRDRARGGYIINASKSCSISRIDRVNPRVD